MIAHTLLGVRFDLGYPIVREYLREYFETCLPLTCKVGQHLSLLQELSSDSFVDDLFVVCDYDIRLQRLIHRRYDYLNVIEALKLLLLLNASAVSLLTLHKQFCWSDDAGNLSDCQQIELSDFVINDCVGFDLFASPFDGFAF